MIIVLGVFASILWMTNEYLDIPTSSRSQEVIHRVSPTLKAGLAEKGLILGSPVFIRIFKEEKMLEVWMKKGTGYDLFRTYPVCNYGSGTLGPKIYEGDGQAPEGFYSVPPSSLHPTSRFHLAFNLGYPNAYDRFHGRTGSQLMVHGSCLSIGCFAMTDPGIEEIYTLLEAAFRSGMPACSVHIFPFKMNTENMNNHASSEWYDFWKDLKEGYDFFELTGRNPPVVRVKDGRYCFTK